MKKIKKSLLFFSLLFYCFGFAVNMPETTDPKINVNNVIITKINNKNISVLDIMKKMDFVFHKAYPNLITSKPARYQFYVSSWKYVLNELINTELMLAEAETKEIKTPDSEIREEIEERFGPNVMKTLENIGLNFDEAFELIKNEIVVKKMMWFFVQSKALLKVTPELIRQNYRLYCEKNPTFDEWEYQVIAIKEKDPTETASLLKKISNLLKDNTQPLEDQKETLKKSLEEEFPNNSIQISSLYKLSSKDVSTAHQEVLQTLEENTYSDPVCQISKSDNKKVHRIFYLKSHAIKNPSSFEEMADKLKDELLQKVSQEESQAYFSKLRKYYNLDTKKLIPDNFEPFSLE